MKSINCDDIQSSLIELIDNNLPTQNAKELILHLDQCDSCRLEFGHFRQVILNGAPFDYQEPEESFWNELPQQVLAQVKEMKTALGAESESTILGSNRKARFGLARLVDWLPQYSFARLALPVAAALLLAVGVFYSLPRDPSYSPHMAAIQQAVNTTSSSADLVKRITRDDNPNPWFAFSVQPAKANAFFVGTYYAESVALLRDVNYRASGEHMSYLQLQLSKHDLNDRLEQTIGEVVKVLNNPETSSNIRSSSLARFESAYEDYIKKTDQDELVMFRLGAWTVNMSLASLAKSKIVLQQKENLAYFNVQLLRLSAPLGVITALEDMQAVLSQPRLSDDDYKKLFDLSMKLRVNMS